MINVQAVIVHKLENYTFLSVYSCRFIQYHCNQTVDNLDSVIQQLSQGKDLSYADAESSAKLLGQETISVDDKISFLKALAIKGETAEEVSAFASIFRGLAIDPNLNDIAENGIDVCGTGGDGFGTFNISTTVSFLVAASGIPVLKHGNRSITSKCGSADLMEALGIHLAVDLEVHRKALEALNFTFFFAPAFHPVFKTIMPARKALASEGQKTIFNLLGPMINPAKPKYQLMGVFSKEWIDPIAKALHALDLKSGMVVHGEPIANSCLDELSCAGKNFHKGFGALSGLEGTLDLTSTGLETCQPNELKGGGVEENITLLLDFAEQRNEKMPVGLRESIYLNAGAAFYCAQKVSSIADGVLVAKETVESGALSKWLQDVRTFYKELS
jgi:anthranilate phosphoribosyltransferase